MGLYGGAKIPPPTKEETQLKQLEYDSLIKQQSQQEAMMPFILQDMGITRTLDPATGEFSYSREEDPQADRLKQQGLDIQEAANARVLSAQKGELDIDPSVEKDIERGESRLREELFRKLGPGSEGSDAWNRAISEFQRQSNSLRYGIRHGEMTTADAISGNRENQYLRRQDQELSQQSSAGNPYLSTAQSLGSGAGSRESSRFRIADFNQRNSGIGAKLIGSAIGGIAGGAGSFFGAKAGAKAALG